MSNENLDPVSDTRRTYDRVAAEYHDKRRDRSLAQSRIARIAALLGPGRHRVLDLGCGPGFDSALIRQSGLCAVGADLSTGMLDFARRTYPGPYLRADMRRLPFAAAFAAVWANASMLHLSPADFPVALAECHRALQAGGYLALSLKAGQGQAWENGRFAVADAPRFFAYWNDDDLDQALQAAGFSPVDGKTGGGMGGHQTWLSRLVQKPR